MDQKVKKFISNLMIKGTLSKDAKPLVKSRFPEFDMRKFPRVWRESTELQNTRVIDIDRIKKPPYDLTDEGLELWIKFWQSKKKEIEIISVDHFMLAAWCEEMGLYRRCRNFIRDNGLKYETDKGNWVQYPEVSTGNNAINNAKAIAMQMGLSPMARKKLGMTSPGLDDYDIADEFEKTVGA